MKHFNSPAEIGIEMCDVSEKKGTLATGKLVVLGILAGAYIALAGYVAAVVMSDLSHFGGVGLSKFMGGSVFSLGLILVVLGGGELFTGNALMVMGLLAGRISAWQLLRNWVVVYFTNFAGSLLVAWLIFLSGLWKADGGVVGVRLAAIAAGKVNLGFLEALVRGILCNWLVCLAVWLAMGGRDAAGKILAIYFPIMAFVASGFEHSVANQFYVPMGIALKGQGAVAGAGLSSLTWASFVFGNLIPVTLGNIIGGAFFVGGLYWYVYLAPRNRDSALSGLRR